MKKNIKILYVDDNDFIREEAIEYLSLIYKIVLEASNGEEALKIYKKEKPDIIITDIEMPIINGLQMVKYIRRHNKKIPIIVVTAFLNTEYLLEAIELHLIKYIVKPVSNHTLDIALSLANQYLKNSNQENIVELAEHSFYDKLNKTLILEKKVVQLTHNEVLLFELLLDKLNVILLYDEIKDEMWSYEEHYMDSLRSLIRVLRHKLKGIVIENVSGLGYRLLLNKEN